MGIYQRKPISNTLFLSSNQTREQGLFLNRLGTLLCEGFSLKEAMEFLKTIADRKQQDWLQQIEHGVNQGRSLHIELNAVGFSGRVCSQIYLSSIHGQFSETILQAGNQLIETAQRKKKIQSIIQYPLMLMLFIIIMLFSMRFILLPHIHRIVNYKDTSMGIGTKFILLIVQSAPVWLSGSALLGCLLILFAYLRTRNKSAIDRLHYFAKSKIIRPYLQLYWTHFFSFEWSQLLDSSCSLIQIVQLMQADETSQLVREVGQWLELELRKGHSFQEAIAQLKFLKPEIKEIVIHGELSGKLGSELKLFALDCETELNRKAESLMERIQPTVFVFVALMIIAIYAALLLPTFSIMEGL